jgi:hypothetical protein
MEQRYISPTRPRLTGFVHGLEAVVHSASVNFRAEAEMEPPNADLATSLVAAFEETDATPRVMFSNSTHVIQQIEFGEPLTVTDPTMTWFMMNIDGAINLVLFAFEHARPGDRFFQKAPTATIATHR